MLSPVIEETLLRPSERSQSSGVTSILAKPRLLIVGAGWAGQTLAEVVLASGKYTVLGFLDDRHAELREVEVLSKKFPIFGDTQDLLSSVQNHKATEIALAITHHRRDGVLSGLVDCYENDVVVHQMPDLYAQLTGKIPIKHVDEYWIAPHLRAPVVNVASCLLNAADYLVTLALVILVFIPVFPFVALAIKLTSKGPLFFFQKRVGYKGRRFTIFKFRTMTHRARQFGASWTVENDVRITPIGGFLRKFRIDELPQLLNVLRGDMALVGPRPEAMDLVAMYRREIPFYEYRYLVKPGITGWAQVEYRNTCSVEGALEKLQYDLFWIKYRSPWMHFKVILKTIRVTLTGFGSV
jgi:exopolysaccharide biosynthesis polyprenyl glycosylphosphotransferase